MNSQAVILALASFYLCASSALADSSMIESDLTHSYHYVDRYEIMIDASPRDVWPHLLDLDSWMYRFDMVHEAGPAGAEGEVVRLYEGQEFLFQIVKVIPERLIVGVNLPSSIEGEDSVGVSMITLAAANGGTLVSNFMSRQYDWSQETPNPVKQRRSSEEFREFNGTLWSGFLARLKELAEQER